MAKFFLLILLIVCSLGAVVTLGSTFHQEFFAKKLSSSLLSSPSTIPTNIDCGAITILGLEVQPDPNKLETPYYPPNKAVFTKQISFLADVKYTGKPCEVENPCSNIPESEICTIDLAPGFHITNPIPFGGVKVSVDKNIYYQGQLVPANSNLRAVQKLRADHLFLPELGIGYNSIDIDPQAFVFPNGLYTFTFEAKTKNGEVFTATTAAEVDIKPR